MFHWICPECGQEIAPGVKECPVCEPVSEHRISPAPAPEASPITLAEEPVAEPEVILQPEVVESLVTAEALTESEVQREPEVILQPEVVESLVTPEVLTESEVQPEPETFADRLADLAERLHGERIPYAAERTIQGTAIPVAPEHAPVIIDVTPAQPLLAPPPSMLLLAEPQPPSVAAELPAGQVFHPRPATQSARSSVPAEAEPSIASPPGAVQIPDRPGRMAAPALAPFQDYYKAADRQMRPAEYTAKAVVSATEPKVTLPGPALPRELMSLQAAGLVPLRSTRRGSGSTAQALYGWKTRTVVLAILLTAGAAYWVRPGASASVPAKPVSEPAAEQPVAARPDNSHSLARFIEVTGVRFVELNKKPQIHYLVVNHSSAALNGVTVYVTLRASSSKPGQPPLSRFSFRSPDLAAFEAKEMASPIERVVGPLDLPDWQDLRADVEVQ